jgi:signal transduction histidine kinase
MKHGADLSSRRSAKHVREESDRTTATRSEAPLERFVAHLERQQESIIDDWFVAARSDPVLQAQLSAQAQFASDLPQVYARLRAHVRLVTGPARVSDQEQNIRAPAVRQEHESDRVRATARAIELLARIVLGSCVTRYAQEEPTFRGVPEMKARIAIHHLFGELIDEAVREVSHDHAVLQQSLEARLAIMKAELEQAASQRQRMMAVVAHELRNFVQALSYTAQLWEKQPDNKKAQVLAQKQIREMQDLLQLLLEHSTLVGARQLPTLVPFDLQALCEELAVVYEEAAAQKGLQLRHECESAPELVLGDRLRIRQIVSNLLSNAIKYTARGEVALRFRVRDEQHWEVHITDTGPGISTEQAARLLNGLGGSENLPGRGIGLGITKDLVTMLGGTIELTSSPGLGSRFVVTFPGRIPIPES